MWGEGGGGIGDGFFTIFHLVRHSWWYTNNITPLYKNPLINEDGTLQTDRHTEVHRKVKKGGAHLKRKNPTNKRFLLQRYRGGVGSGGGTEC